MSTAAKTLTQRPAADAKSPAPSSPSSPSHGKKAPSKAAASEQAPRKTAGVARRSAPPEKDPHGGLTAAGRAAFSAKDGSHLRPGVTKPDAEMSPEDMKRKGSWAVRFYGRASLPPLVDTKGQPTRFALSAHAWGEPVPKTEAQARSIAEKGRRLLERHAQAIGKEAAMGKKSAAKTATARKPSAAKKAPVRKRAAKKVPAE